MTDKTERRRLAAPGRDPVDFGTREPSEGMLSEPSLGGWVLGSDSFNWRRENVPGVGNSLCRDQEMSGHGTLVVHICFCMSGVLDPWRERKLERKGGAN